MEHYKKVVSHYYLPCDAQSCLHNWFRLGSDSLHFVMFRTSTTFS